jgi:hypothetical protein
MSKSADGPERTVWVPWSRRHFHDSPMNLLICISEIDKLCLRHRILTSPTRREQYLVRLKHDRAERGVPKRVNHVVR